MQVSFYNTDLESIDADLFKFNLKLTYVNFGANRLKHVGENLFSNLKHLQFISFQNNPCIDVTVFSSSGIPALVQKLKSQCKWSYQAAPIKDNEQLNAEIIALKIENQVQ